MTVCKNAANFLQNVFIHMGMFYVLGCRHGQENRQGQGNEHKHRQGQWTGHAGHKHRHGQVHEQFKFGKLYTKNCQHRKCTQDQCHCMFIKNCCKS
jgi:hypothetical protein